MQHSTLKFLKAIPFVFLLYNMSLFAENTGQTEKESRLVNRRVLILDFVNVKNALDYEYLETSIPEAFSGSLDKTKKFEIIDRSIWSDLLKTGKYQKKDAFIDRTALAIAAENNADVVLIGSYITNEDQMQIFAKVIEVESKRVMINRRVKSNLDTSMFDAVDNLADELAAEMSKKLPPVAQKVLIKEKIIDTATARTYGGMLWRTAVIPGLGHIYAKEWRGWVYGGLWLGSIGTGIYLWIDYDAKKTAYEKATSGLQDKYDEYSVASFSRLYPIIALGSTYLIALTDILIFGKNYEILSEKQPLIRWDIALYPAPFYGDGQREQTIQINGNFQVQYCF